MRLLIYSNRHIKEQIHNLKDNDYLVLKDETSVDLWKYYSDSIIINTINIVLLNELLEGKLDNMKFDYIVGNPPYQDGKRGDGQNKIYNQICNKCINLLSPNGVISFVTPVAVTRPSKRFSLIDYMVKEVDFSVNANFDIGQTVCSWTIDKTYNEDIKVIHSDKSISYNSQKSIVFDNLKNKEMVDLYYQIKEHTKKLDNRMFQRNNFGPAFTNEKTDYPIESKTKELFSKRIPHFYNKNKLIFRLSSTFKPDNFFEDIKDYDQNHVCVDVDEYKENILSFIFSDYFVQYVEAVKEFEASMSFNALTYVPQFDKTKKWTNEEVKSFFENKEYLN